MLFGIVEGHVLQEEGVIGLEGAEWSWSDGALNFKLIKMKIITPDGLRLAQLKSEYKFIQSQMKSIR